MLPIEHCSEFAYYITALPGLAFVIQIMFQSASKVCGLQSKPC